MNRLIRLSDWITLLGTLAVITLITTTADLKAADQLTAEQAGTIGRPTGKIAFTRDKNVWTMDVHGGHQMVITEVMNADGRLSWAPDNKRIVFTRSGTVDLRGPDNLGGKHKVYDLFLAYVDSAMNSNTTWWYRISDGLGSRDPEWSADGKTIIFYKDMNANSVNAFLPNYQVCTMSDDGDNLEILRKDWRNMSEFMVAPTLNPNGDIAAVHYAKTSQGSFRSQGLVKMNRESFMVSLDSISKMSNRMPELVGPAWSPDGQWLAFYSNSMSDPGLFVAPADLSKRYLVFSPPPGTSLQTIAPSFSPNSKWLTFATRDGSIWICDITGNGAKRISGPGMDSAPAWSK